MTKTKKVKKKSCAKVTKFVSPALGTPVSGVLTNCSKVKTTFQEVGQEIKDMPPITLDDVIKKIQSLQKSKITCFICFVFIAFALIAAILVLYNENTLSVSYLLLPCLVISVFKAAEIFFSELTNN